MLATRRLGGHFVMPEYRAYIIGSDGHILSVEPLISDYDDTAIAAAKRLLVRHDIELWQGRRKVTTLLAHKLRPLKPS